MIEKHSRATGNTVIRSNTYNQISEGSSSENEKEASEWLRTFQN